MSVTQQRRLGDVAYNVHEDGSITRTIVNRLGLEGEYSFLEHSHGPAFFDIGDAINQAKDILSKKEAELTREFTKVRAKLAVLDTGGYRKDIAEAPLRRVSGSIIGASFGLDGEVKPGEIVVPESYHMPGQRVFCVITPKTFNHMSPHYRPCAYFVLEAHVKEVHLGSGGRAQYWLDSSYHPQELSLELDTAKQMLVDAFARETDGTLALEQVRLVSHDEEQAAERASHGQISKQVGKQFERFSDLD